MEYFILNEHSLTLNSDTATIDSCLSTFFSVYKKAISKNFKHIRVSENVDSKWYETNLGNETTFRHWILKQKDQDFARSLKSLITSTSTPIFTTSDSDHKLRHSYSAFRYNDIDVPILGAVFFLKQLSISLNSKAHWCESTFELDCEELSNNDEIVSQKVTVCNVTTLEHWDIHYEEIEKKKIESAKNICNRLELIDNQFPHVIFLKEARRQLKESDPSFFEEIWECLSILNETAKNLVENKSFNYQRLIETCGLTISDESDTVKTNPTFSGKRKFMFNGQRLFFGYHIKNFSSSRRLHFIIHEDKLVIGYIGKHLPTKSDPK